MADRPKKEQITLYYYEEDICKLWAYETFINKCIERKQKIPSYVIKRFVSFFERAPLDDLKQKETLIQSAKERILFDLQEAEIGFAIRLKIKHAPRLEHTDIDFTTSPNYGEHLKTAKEYSIYSYSIKHFLDYFFAQIDADDKFYLTIADKVKFIETAYRSLSNYLEPVPVKKQPKFYTKCVIVGVLAANFRLLLSKKEHQLSPSSTPYYTEYLHNQTKYICKKIKQKQSKS